MRKIILYFLILLASIWLGIKIYENPGYVLISYKNWVIESTIWFGILFFILLVILAYFLVRLLIKTLHIPEYFSRWRRRRRNKKANKYMRLGLMQLLQGEWAKAEKLLQKSMKWGDNSIINYLAAAKAASNQYADERCEKYIELALKKNPQSRFLIELAQAKMFMGQRKFSDALGILLNLKQERPHHPYLLRLLCETFMELKEWELVIKMLPELRKNKSYDDIQYENIEHMSYFQLLKSQPFADMDALQEFWRSLPKHLQDDPIFLAEYTQQLKKYNLDDEAEKLLRQKLNKKWDVNLFNIYIQTNSKDPAKQLAMVEQWGKKFDYDPITLRSLGFFFLRNQLWGQAKTYLEESLKRKPSLEAFAAMGMVMEKLGEEQKALFYYRKSFSMVES